jgi:hypothetical protein
MCRCDYGNSCKDNCGCRCHSESSSTKIARLEAEIKLINQAWIDALHNNDIVDMKDAGGENMKTICLFVDEELKRLRSKPA